MGSPSSEREQQTIEKLMESASYWRSRVVLTSVKLDIYSRLSQGSKTAAEIARELKGDQRAYEIFLDALVAVGLLHKKEGRYSNTDIAREFLLKESPRYKGHMLILSYDSWHLWGKLEETLRTGHSPRKDALFFEDPVGTENLITGLHIDALQIAPALAQNLDLSQCESLLDLGGGGGTYSIFFCKANPRLKATIFDLPYTLKVTKKIVGDFHMEERIRLVEGDFIRDPFPQTYDAVFASNILHGNGPDVNRALLKKINQALNPRGMFIIRDVIMSQERTYPEWGAVFAVNMLLETREGRCYSLEEIYAWLKEAEFHNMREWEPDSIVIATKE